jgi:hypothetical protein
MLWILLVTAGAGVSAVLAVGYIANRYLADFMPVLCLGSAFGIVDLFRRADLRMGETRPAPIMRRRVISGRLAWGGMLTVGVAVLAFAGVVANVALSSTPDDPVAWQGTRVQAYVHRQETFSKYTGHPLSANVERGTRLPSWAPADKLFVLGNCSALYLSDGETYHTWIPVDFGPGLRQAFDVVVRRPSTQMVTTPVIGVGRDLVTTVRLEQLDTRVRVVLDDPLFPASGPWLALRPDRRYSMTVDIDTQLHTIKIAIDGQPLIDSPLSTGEQEVVTYAGRPTAATPQGVTFINQPVPEPPLCRGLN